MSGTSEGRPTDDERDLDRFLLRRVINREGHALERLYDRYSVVSLTVIARIVRDQPTAEDLLQDVFLQVWRRAETFDEQRGVVRGWILGIAHNLALNELRRQRHRPRTEPSGSGDPPIDRLSVVPDPGPSPEDLAWLAEQRTQISRAMKGLPENQRRVITLYAMGYSQSEIAARTEQPLGSVKTWMRRGLQVLRDSLDQTEAEQDGKATT